MFLNWPSRSNRSIRLKKPRRVQPFLRYYPALDGLRGIAVLLVVIGHLHLPGEFSWGFLSGGILGVDIFFVLSGYLITSILIGECKDGAGKHLRRFYLRRAARLLPALFVLLTGVNAAAYFQSMSAAEWERLHAATAASLFYFANFLYAKRCGDLGSLGHLWSLSVEEQFYILEPVVLLVGFTRGWSARRFLVLSGAVYGVCFALRASAVFRPDVSHCELMSVLALPYNRLGGLLVGAAVSFIHYHRREEAGRTLARALAYLSLPAMVYCVAVGRYDSPILYQWQLDLFWISTGCLVYSLVTLEHTAPAAVLRSAPLRWFGKISYSLYLWHIPVLVYMLETPSSLPGIVGVAGAFLVSVLLAALSFYLVEQPVRKYVRSKEKLWLK